MVEVLRRTRVVEGVAADRIPFDELMESGQPVVLRGLARTWPLVARGLESAESAAAYLKSFCTPKPTTVYVGDAAIRGRFFYDTEYQGFNFDRKRLSLAECIDRVLAHADEADAPALYAGSTDVDIFLPGLRAQNDLALDHPMFRISRPTVSIWIGNRTVASAHYDQSHNLACCMVGRRRFTLFPPEQIHNLYPGPLEPTPAGQVISVVDFDAPDFGRFPRFRQALEAGESAVLDPGDVLFYPALWWHHVEALDAFNAMINYWWNPAPAFLDSPHHTLLHALLSLRDRPDAEKRAWRAFFDFYVFGPADTAARHLPEKARGNLGPMDELKARRLRAFLLSRFNR
jgi:hypothetical protein